MNKSMAPVGRPSAGPRKDVHVRVPDAMLVELFLYKPHMMAPGGGVKYGAIQEYLLGLMQLDLEQTRKRLQEQNTHDTQG